MGVELRGHAGMALVMHRGPRPVDDPVGVGLADDQGGGAARRGAGEGAGGQGHIAAGEVRRDPRLRGGVPYNRGGDPAAFQIRLLGADAGGGAPGVAFPIVLRRVQRPAGQRQFRADRRLQLAVAG